jgi:hypothetical protein
MDKRLNMPLSVGQFTIKWTLEGQQARNVLYMRHLDGPHGTPEAFVRADLEQAAKGLRDAYEAAFIDKTASSAEITGIDAVGNTNVGAGPLIETTDNLGTYPIPGTNSPGVTANNVTLAIKLATGLGGRSYHGRFYFVGVGPGIYNSTQPNQLKSASVGDFEGAFSDFITDVEAIPMDEGNVELVVCSFITANTDRVPALATTVTSLQLTDTTFDSQRRRLPGRGT